MDGVEFSPDLLLLVDEMFYECRAYRTDPEIDITFRSLLKERRDREKAMVEQNEREL